MTEPTKPRTYVLSGHEAPARPDVRTAASDLLGFLDRWIVKDDDPRDWMELWRLEDALREALGDAPVEGDGDHHVYPNGVAR